MNREKNFYNNQYDNYTDERNQYQNYYIHDNLDQNSRNGKNSTYQNYYYGNFNRNEKFHVKKSFAKNYSRKVEGEEEDIVQNSEYIPAEYLKSYCKEDFENIKLVEVECPINSNLMIIDISLNPKGVDEEITYLQYPEYIKNIRRGNTLVEFYFYNKHTETYELKCTEMARKGMMKFVDLPYEIIDTKDNRFKSTEHLKEDSKFNAKKIIMDPILKSLKIGNKINIFKLIKANGENAQISYCKRAGMWVISSKNVCLLAANRKDLELYYPLNKQGEPNRYSFAYIIGHCWFDILEKISVFSADIVESLKIYLNGKTMIGEYVGNQNYQHLIRYMKHTILFYAIVDNYSEENSFPVEEAYEKFKSFHLDVVPYEKIGLFDDFYTICAELEKLYVRIAESSIIEEEEGSVLYFSEVGKTERILALCKLKTLEYRVYRKLREKLKNHLLQNEENKFFESRRKINQFFEEVRIMLQGYNLPMPMSFYYRVAETAFAFANKFYGKCSNLHRSYIDFLEVIHSIIDQTVDLKSRVIKGDNIMTYDYLVKNELISKKVIEIIIYAPPVYLTDEFFKALEKKYSIEIRNSFIQSKEYYNLNTSIVIYHINMHNFRVFSKLEENKFIITFGLNETECNYAFKKLNEKLKNPQFISYNTNTSLSPFLNLDEASRKEVENYFVLSSLEFIEKSRKYIGNKFVSYEKFEETKIELYIQEFDKLVMDLSQSVKKMNDEKLMKDSFLFSVEEDVNKEKYVKEEYYHNVNKKITQNYKDNRFIKLYETHSNPYLELKEIFLKEEKLMGYNGYLKESSVKYKKEIVILVPMTIPGTGKTFFVDQLKDILNRTNIAFDSISSDTIRKEFMDKLMQRGKMDRNTAFSRTGKSSTIKFESELRKKFKTLVQNNDQSLLYIDKNHPPNAISRVFEPIKEEMNLIPESIMKNCNVKFVSLLPDCCESINVSDNITVPFSLSYFIQCYVRIRHRKNHQTLNGDHENLICILGMFINNFMNFTLNEKNLILHYHFDKAIKLPFTKEFSEDKINSDLIASAKEYFRNLSGGNAMPVYDTRAANFEKLINKYYKFPDSFASTKDLVRNTAEPIVKKLFNNYNNEFQDIKNNMVDNEKPPEIKLNQSHIKEDGNTRIKKGLNSLFNDDSKIVFQEKQQNYSDLNSKITQKCSSSITGITNNNIKKYPSKFIYLGLAIYDQKEKMIRQVLLESIKSFMNIDNSSELFNFYNSLQNNTLPFNWKFPHQDQNIWHSTTLFKGSNPIENYYSHQALKEFEENKSIPVFINGLVYVPGKIITGYIETPAFVDNEIPHISIALCNNYPPKKSNEVLKTLFQIGGKLEKDFIQILASKDNTTWYLKKLEIKLEGMFVDCYVLKFNPAVKFEAKMHAFN